MNEYDLYSEENSISTSSDEDNSDNFPIFKEIEISKKEEISNNNNNSLLITQPSNFIIKYKKKKKIKIKNKIKKNINPIIKNDINNILRLQLIKEKKQKYQEDLFNLLEKKEKKLNQNLQELFLSKSEKILKINEKIQKRTSLALNKKIEQEYNYRLSAYNQLLKLDEYEERYEKNKKEIEFNLQEKAAERWLKQKIALQMAKQTERRKLAIAKQRLLYDENLIKKIEEEKNINKNNYLFKKQLIQKTLFNL